MLDGQFLLVQYGVKVELDTSPYGKSRTWVALDQGFDNLDEALNDVVNEYFFLGDKGFGSDFVTGIHPKYTLSGVRVVGDPAQDYIFDNKFHLMAGRDTNLRISIPKADGTVIRFTSKITLSDMKSFGGATTDGGAVNVTLSFKGAPVVDTVAPSTALTVSSVYGGTAGTTTLTIAPYYPDAGCKFAYTYGDEIAPVQIGDVVIDWNDLTNGFTYEIPNGKTITVVMVNSATFKVVGIGSAIAVSEEQLAEITVLSEAGTQAGDSLITITGATGALVYKVGATAEVVAYGDDVSTWDSITSGTEITATSGDIISVCEIDADSKAIGFGSATIVSA